MKRSNNKTKKRIVEHALKLFAKKGFFGSTVDDIAKAAGVAKGTVYLYFKDKSSIYIASIEDRFDHAIQFIADIEELDIPASDKLYRIATRLLSYMQSLKSALPLFTFENIDLTSKMLKGLKPVVMPKVSHMTEIVAHVIRTGIDEGEFRKVNPDTAALCFLSAIRSAFFTYHFVARAGVDLDTVLTLYLDGLRKRR
jgi:TetR/AcrR family fatty acid metabolism transcriptional regulator